jgi:two-component system, NarL family, response regulator NreC
MENWLEVVSQAEGGCEGLIACRAAKPEVLIMDVRLGDLDAVHVLREIRAEGLNTKVLVYSGCEREELERSILSENPEGFVRKAEPLAVLLAGLRAVCDGLEFRSPASRQLNGDGEMNAERLTRRELAVLQMVAGGKLSKEIAEVLGLTVKAVDHHRQHIMNKLGMHDTASLAGFAIRKGLA